MMSNATTNVLRYSLGMNLIELRRLRAFVAVAEEGHITRAAERLGMQQPPLTRLLHGLEKELGVLLMHRLPRGVRPTEAGKALLAEARAVLARAEGLNDAVRRAAWQAGRTLQVFHVSGAGADHPYLIHVPEGRYLKAVFCRVVGGARVNEPGAAAPAE